MELKDMNLQQVLGNPLSNLPKNVHGGGGELWAYLYQRGATAVKPTN